MAITTREFLVLINNLQYLLLTSSRTSLKFQSLINNSIEPCDLSTLSMGLCSLHLLSCTHETLYLCDRSILNDMTLLRKKSCCKTSWGSSRGRRLYLSNRITLCSQWTINLKSLWPVFRKVSFIFFSERHLIVSLYIYHTFWFHYFFDELFTLYPRRSDPWLFTLINSSD